jgi:hypothetical protein
VLSPLSVPLASSLRSFFLSFPLSLSLSTLSLSLTHTHTQTRTTTHRDTYTRTYLQTAPPRCRPVDLDHVQVEPQLYQYKANHKYKDLLPQPPNMDNFNNSNSMDYLCSRKHRITSIVHSLYWCRRLSSLYAPFNHHILH